MNSNLNELSNPDRSNRDDAESEPSQTMSEADLDTAADAALADLRETLEFEELMQEPPEGDLSIISDQDVPGAPG